jgi:hypothetical protein
LKDPTLGAANPNVWDDGKEGNFWSDSKTQCPNATELGSTGAWDTPYYINENNIDQHPLLNPVAIREVPTESSSAPQPTNSPTDGNTREQQPDSLDITLPIEYGYGTIAVAAITIISGYWFFKSKKSLVVTENSLPNRRCG